MQGETFAGDLRLALIHIPTLVLDIHSLPNVASGLLSNAATLDMKCDGDDAISFLLVSFLHIVWLWLLANETLFTSYPCMDTDKRN